MITEVRETQSSDSYHFSLFVYMRLGKYPATIHLDFKEQ